jgi:Thiolase, C-terminal domain
VAWTRRSWASGRCRWCARHWSAPAAKVLDEMERRDLELDLVTLCIGGGQGITLLLGR